MDLMACAYSENRAVRPLEFVVKQLSLDDAHLTVLPPVFCLRTLRELKLLRYFAEQNVSENVRDAVS